MAGAAAVIADAKLPKRLTGHMNKLEQRAIGGPSKRRYWFVLSDDSPYLYWYKNRGDISCVGRICLSGAAFIFDPRDNGSFEIHADNEVHVLQSYDKKSRAQWLKQLQTIRRNHFERGCSNNIPEVEIMSLASHSLIWNEEMNESIVIDKKDEMHPTEVVVDGPPDEKSLEEEILEAQSKFYIGSDGELNENSLEMPPLLYPNSDVLKNAEEILNKIAEETQLKARSFEQPARKVIGKAKATLRLPSLSSNRACEQCQILIGVVNALKDRCYELTDELNANRDLVVVLRQSLLKSSRQIDLLKRMEDLKTSDDRISLILEKESELTAWQLNAAANGREVRSLKEQNTEKEQKISDLNAEIEAYRESVKSKDELIMRMCAEQTADDGSIIVEDGIEVPEGLLVDFGSTETDQNAQRVFDEASVDDVTEMRDLVEGYRSQNMFLNQEVLELQKIIHSLEDRERRIARQNFDIEACYYQLKSRYIMVLNHFKTNRSDNGILEPGVIEALIDETNWTANKRTLSGDNVETRLTDSFGFYLNGQRHCERIQKGDVLEVAAELKNKSDQIVDQQELEQSPQYIEWLQKWDSFLVNTVSKPLRPGNELKNLIRTGVPKTYRRRVWKSLINYVVHDQRADLGNGYYETLLKKVHAVERDGGVEADSALKQIDLDLTRTLPTNRYFDEPTSEKIDVLRRVLFAYRFHNKAVGYCQGLNRLAAIALLFLDESDAFWFLVACVEHLQPASYYSPSLYCAIADQRVLRDLVGEKLPKLSAHLRKFDVDLSAFTLSWFLTCFVDIFPHSIYLNTFDVFLYEGNKVLFRFALAVLKLAEASIIDCKTVGAVQASLSKVAQYVSDYKTLSRVAFNDLNPFPQKAIETKRHIYMTQLAVSIFFFSNNGAFKSLTN